MPKHPLVAVLFALAACGRSMVYDCSVSFSPASLDFGAAVPGTPVTRTLSVTSLDNEACQLSGIGVAPGSDPGFSLEGPTSLSVEPGTSAIIPVSFDPGVGPPYQRRGTLLLQTSDLTQSALAVPLSGEVAKCTLTIAPADLDFTNVPLGIPVLQTLTLTNAGQMTCEVSALTLAPGSDPGFSLPASESQGLSIAPGASASLSVEFEVATSATPFVRHGTLTFETGDPAAPKATVALTAWVPSCNLGVSPTTLNFGNVILNSSASGQVTLTNDGGIDCDVSQVALGSGTDPDFSLPPQPRSFSVIPGGSAEISVTFNDLSGDTAPLLRQGTLTFQTGDLATPSAEVPLQAFVSTICTEASQWIYTVDQNATFSRFDPTTLTFTDLGVLSCPAQPGASPFSMAVDQNAVAWVVYTSGELFQVDTGTAACQATGFQPNQQGVLVFGMSFVFQPQTGLDTLFVAGGGQNWNTSGDLATIGFPSLVLSTIAPVPIGAGELAGTGDGELWDFVDSEDSFSGTATLAQLDPATAGVLTSFQYPSLTTQGGFATKFWGGSFWIFLGPSVFEVPRATGVLSTAIANTGRDIVGAGVSTCAPVQ
jgi:hypothetical protein